MRLLLIQSLSFSFCLLASQQGWAQSTPASSAPQQPAPQQPALQQPAPQQPVPQPPVPQHPAPQQPAPAPLYPAPSYPQVPASAQRGAQPAPPPLAPSLPATTPAHGLPYQGPVAGSNPKYFERTTFELEAELADTGTGGPIAFLVIGVPALAFGGAWLARSIFRYDECRHDYRYGVSDGNYYYEDERKRPCQTRQVLGMIGGSLAIAVGLPFATLGTILLPLRLAKRGRLTREIELRRKYSGQVNVSLNHTVSPTAGGGLAYVLSGTF